MELPLKKSTISVITLAEEIRDLATESPDLIRFSDMSDIVCSRLPDLVGPFVVGVCVELEIVFSSLLLETEDIDFTTVALPSSSLGIGLPYSPESRFGGLTVHLLFLIGCCSCSRA